MHIINNKNRIAKPRKMALLCGFFLNFNQKADTISNSHSFPNSQKPIILAQVSAVKIAEVFRDI